MVTITKEGMIIEPHLINAREAQTASRANRKTLDQKVYYRDLDKITNLINRAVKNGEYSILLDYPPCPSVIDTLHEQGYQTKINYGFFRISWENPNET